MMNRRDFLDSVLGTLALTKIPFLAIEQPLILGKNNKELLFTLTNDQLKKNIQGIIYAGYQEELYPIKSPNIISIMKCIDGDKAVVGFEFEPVEATTDFITNKAGLLFRNSKEIITSSDFYNVQHLYPTDILKVKYIIDDHLPKRQLQAFKDLM